MWAAIVKGTVKASEFFNSNTHRCPFTNVVITEEEYQENCGNPMFQPKWRLRKRPNSGDCSSSVDNVLDKQFSNELLIQRIRIWEKKNKFMQPPALKADDIQLLSSFNERGFSKVVISNDNQCDIIYDSNPIRCTLKSYLLMEHNPMFVSSKMEPLRPHLEPQKNDVCFPVPYDTPGDTSSIDLANLYLWSLLHSRADKVVACKTFGDWKRLFYDTIHLAFPSYHEWITLHKSKTIFLSSWEKARFRMFEENINPTRALYLISTKSNFWPYGVESYIPKWTVSPYRRSFKSSVLRERMIELEEMKRNYPKNSVFTVYKTIAPKKQGPGESPGESPETHQEPEIEGGRNATGLCYVKTFKMLNDSTEIAWLVNASYLKKMKRIHIYLEKSPWPKIHDDIVDYYSDD